MMKLHLGCEQKHLPGYINVDIQDTGAADIMFDITDIGKHIPKDSVDIIYISHVLEHFERGKAEELINKMFYVLKRQTGILRIAVPDFEAICKQYMETKNLDELHGLLYGRHDIPFEGHYTIWDFTTLRNMLTDVGFSRVNKYNWKDTDHADIDDYSQAYLPHMDKKNGRLMSLNVEATKPL